MTEKNSDKNGEETTDETVEQTEKVEQSEPVDSVEETTDDGDDTGNPNAEAAKYRKRLRETETERDALAERLEAYQRREVESYASNLQKPSAIWAAGLELESVLNDDGEVDAGKVQHAVQVAVTELGLAPARQLQPHPAQMADGGEAVPGLGPDDRMAQVIQGRKKS